MIEQVTLRYFKLFREETFDISDSILECTPTSKTLLPGFFKAAGVSLTKNEYYQVAAQMLPEEIPRKVREKLNVICEAFDMGRM